MYTKEMNIGVFDSGTGGRLVAAKLKQAMPENSYFVCDDAAHAPYGNREYDDIRTLTESAIQPLLATCPIVVIACNTATVAAIAYLRTQYADTIFVGFEPMIKVAAELSVTRHVTLLATNATAHSKRTRELISLYAQDFTIDTPDTTDWAKLVDAGLADTINLGPVEDSIADGSDVIIIGCTHYIALKARLEAFGKTVIEPTEAVASRIQQLIES